MPTLAEPASHASKKDDATGPVLVAWSAVRGFATLWVHGGPPFEGLEPKQLAREIGRLITPTFGDDPLSLTSRPFAPQAAGIEPPGATRAAREDRMAESVYKVIELVGTSSESWEKAAAAAIERASKSLRDLRVAQVLEQDLVIEKGKVEAYRTKLKVSFKYEGKD
jgi:hypothetical protein